MASKKTQMDVLAKKTKDLTLKSTTGSSIQADDFYPNRKSPINFSRLEKGLLLFIYVYENAKNTLASEMALWDYNLCFYQIKDGKCTKPSDQCHRQHQTTYRQPNLCSFWYISKTCKNGSQCKFSHQFEDVAKYHRYLCTETEVNVYKLIRFIRNFAGHYLDSEITNDHDQQDLYKNIIVAMVYRVHTLSPKHSNSIEHLTLLLDGTTINQLIPENDLLVELEKSCDIPEVFFDLRMNFNSHWYQRGANKQVVNFQQVSSEFLRIFADLFRKYFQGRLKSRGAKQAWP